MNDLLDRYLATVARELPAAQRADIIAELRDALLFKIESQEETLARPLSRDELEAALKAFGHPLVVAGRYRKVQHLVGPEVFPFWWLGLKLTFLAIAALYLVAFFVNAVFVTERGVIDLPEPAGVLLASFGVVTLVAMGVERLGLTTFLYHWRPSDLPPAGVKATSRFEALVDIGIEGAFLLWWTGVIHVRDWIAVSPALVVDLAPIWRDLYGPVLAFAIAGLVVNLFALLRPGWTRLNAALALARTLAGAALAVPLFQAARSVIVAVKLMEPGEFEKIQATVDRSLHIALAVILSILAIRAVLNTRRLWLAIKAGG